MEDKWHPLDGKVPYDSRHDRGDIALCGELIKKARNLWKGTPDEQSYQKWKLDAAQYLYDNCLETKDVYMKLFPFCDEPVLDGICKLLMSNEFNGEEIDWMHLFIPLKKRQNLDSRINCCRIMAILVIRHAYRALKDFFKLMECDQGITKEIRTAERFVQEIQFADTHLKREIAMNTFIDDIRIAEV